MISINTAQAIGIGFIQIKPDGEIYLHTDEKLTKDTPIYIQIPSENAEMLCCRKLQGSDFTGLGDSDVVTTETTIVKKYVLRKSVISTKDELNIGMSVIGANKVIVKKNLIYAINKKNHFFIKRCFGIEGVNLRMSNTTKFKKPIKSMYYSLGYDIEPNKNSCQ